MSEGERKEKKDRKEDRVENSTEGEGCKKKQQNENKIIIFFLISGAFHVPPWASVVEVAPPVAVGPSLDVVAARVVGEELQAGRRDEVVVPVHHLEVPEVGGAVEALAWEVAAAHLRRRVRPRRSGVDDLAAELHHVGVPRQVGEEVGRPVPDDQARAQL